MSEVTPAVLNPFLTRHFGAGETRLTRIGGADWKHVRPAQRKRDHVADRGLVFDDQDAFLHGSPIRQCLPWQHGNVT